MMNFQNAVLLVQTVLVIILAIVTVYKNRTQKYTKGLPWPLEPLSIWLHSRVGQPWTAKYFNAEAQTNPLTAVYCAVMKMEAVSGRMWILLVPRKDETYTEGVVHIVGSMIRFSDAAGFFADAIKRVLQGELRGAKCTEPVLAGARLTKVRRGNKIVTEVSIVTVCEWTGTNDPEVGTWSDVTDLPGNLIDHERKFIFPLALARFREMPKV